MNKEILFRLPNDLNCTLTIDLRCEATNNLLTGFGMMCDGRAIQAELIARKGTDEVYAKVTIYDISLAPDAEEWEIFSEEYHKAMEFALILCLQGYVMNHEIPINQALQDELDAMPIDTFIKQMTKTD